MGAKFGRKIAYQLEISRLRDIIGADDIRADQAADRGDHNDRAFPPLDHFGGDHRDEPMIGEHIIVEDLAKLLVGDARHGAVIGVGSSIADQEVDRSEEHTSELQSLMRISYAVFCLKKKNH